MKLSFLLLAVFISVNAVIISSCKKKDEGLQIRFTIQTTPKKMLQMHCIDPQNPEFIKVLRMTDSIFLLESKPYIELFVESWETINPTYHISLFFKGNSKENKQFIHDLNTEFDQNIEETIDIITKRLENYGVNVITVSKTSIKGIIEFEINGIDKLENVRKIITNQYFVEFFETYENSEIFDQMIDAETILFNEYPKQIMVENEESEEKERSLLDSIPGETETELNSEDKRLNEEHTLTSLLALNIHQNEKGETTIEKGPAIGYCMIKDTAKVNSMLQFVFDSKKSPFPHDLYFFWTLKPEDENSEFLQLVLIKKRNKAALLDGNNIAKAYVQDQSGFPEIGLDFTYEGAKIFQQMTNENVGKAIAIVINGSVYSFPTVMSEISGGKCMISGKFTKEEAEETAVLINSGMLPIDVKIIKEIIVKKEEGK